MATIRQLHHKQLAHHCLLAWPWYQLLATDSHRICCKSLDSFSWWTKQQFVEIWSCVLFTSRFRIQNTYYIQIHVLKHDDVHCIHLLYSRKQEHLTYAKAPLKVPAGILSHSVGYYRHWFYMVLRSRADPKRRFDSTMNVDSMHMVQPQQWCLRFVLIIT